VSEQIFGEVPTDEILIVFPVMFAGAVGATLISM